MIRIFGCVCALILTAQMVLSQDASGLAQNAINLNRYGQTLEGPGRMSVLQDVRRILDRVVIEYPASPEAEAIRAGQSLGELNVAGLNAELAGEPPIPDFDSGTRDPAVPQLDGLQLGGPVPVAPFDPKARMKMVQETLNARGCKTGTPDGVKGRRTTRGYQRFLKEKGLSEAQYPIESEAFWNVLLSSEGEVCEIIIVPVTPQTMLGNWRYNTRCGRGSKAPGAKTNGIFYLRSVSGNGFTGTVKNNHGMTASVRGRVDGRRISMSIRWLFLKATAVGTVADEAYVVHGRDSDGCRFTARKM